MAVGVPDTPCNRRLFRVIHTCMARPTYYVPVISRPVVAALFHESKRHRIPMTRLVDKILKDALQGTPGWSVASQDWPELTAPHQQDQRSA